MRVEVISALHVRQRANGRTRTERTKGRANERSNAIMHCSAKFGERESSRLARSAEKMTQERESERAERRDFFDFAR